MQSRSRSRRTTIALVVFSLAACGEDYVECPDKELPVTAHEGAPPTETRIECEGIDLGSMCREGVETYVSDHCDGLSLMFTTGIVGPAVLLYIDPQQELASVRMSFPREEETEGTVHDAESGHVELLVNPDGSVVGTFEAEFSSATLRGVFNSAYDPGDDP